MILLDGSSLTLEQLTAIADGGEAVGIAPGAGAQIHAAREVVDRTAVGIEPVYGINTGFGSLAEVRIAPDALEALQLNLVFAESGEIISGGNFHGAPIALAADLVAVALVPLATISERRTDRFVDPARSGLPAFLTRESGLRSGLMLAHVTAAAVVRSQNARPPGIGRYDSDLRQQRGSRQHEHGGGAEGHARPIARPDTRRGPSVIGRHRRDRRAGCDPRAGKRVRRSSQVKNKTFSN